MIAPQSPPLEVFVPIERVLRDDVPLEHFSSISTIQANHIIVLHGSPHRYSRCENFLCLNGLSEVTQRVMNCGDQVRKLLWFDRLVPNVAADDHSRGMRVGLFGIHDHPFALSWLTTCRSEKKPIKGLGIAFGTITYLKIGYMAWKKQIGKICRQNPRK
jgi:hypothetical protein